MFKLNNKNTLENFVYIMNILISLKLLDKNELMKAKTYWQLIQIM